ncbi:MAG: hypothetical protein AAF725_05445 [Acidobacteriota bacterium]
MTQHRAFSLKSLLSRALPAFSIVAALLLLPADGALASTEGRLKVLLLDYHEPIEHDVLLSHLCVEPCTTSAGCPRELVAKGVDYFSDDLAVYRPRYLGQSARFVVQAYKDKEIDLLSISGHHASGFSGEFGRGSFHTTKLAGALRGLDGREGFFTSPGMVMLQGCWTDVKSGFEGDPIEYVRHIVEDTAVRDGQAGRLLAAIQQIAGEDEAYRDLFPNACILGYKGTQIPGGLAEIYGQTNNLFRAVEELIEGESRDAKFSFAQARRSAETLDQLVRDIDRECGGRGWPCNLCSQDEDYYTPLAASVIRALAAERDRLSAGRTRPKGEALALERQLEDNALYANVRWSCSTAPTSTAPRFPEPIDRGPHLELFMQLLMMDLGEIRGAERQRIESELVHLLGATDIVDEATRDRLRQTQIRPEGTAWRRAFYERTLRGLSTFRQRDFYDFLSTIGCRPCFREVLTPETPRQLRENAASQLRPRLGPEIYRLALGDTSARVRRLAASRLAPGLPPELADLALGDADARVVAAAQKALAEAPPEARVPLESQVPVESQALPEAQASPVERGAASPPRRE